MDEMRFSFPCFPAEFELPYEWLADAGMIGFRPLTAKFRSTADAKLSIPLRDIEPPFRYPEHPKDFRGFERLRMVHILSRIVADAEIDPVPVLALSGSEFLRPPFQYRVLDGVHRFYASIAAGFANLPAVLA
jgi:hypothetical protein